MTVWPMGAIPIHPPPEGLDFVHQFGCSWLLLLVGDDDAHLAGSQRRSSKDSGGPPQSSTSFPVVGDVAAIGVSRTDWANLARNSSSVSASRAGIKTSPVPPGPGRRCCRWAASPRIGGWQLTPPSGPPPGTPRRRSPFQSERSSPPSRGGPHRHCHRLTGRIGTIHLAHAVAVSRSSPKAEQERSKKSPVAVSGNTRAHRPAQNVMAGQWPKPPAPAGYTKHCPPFVVPAGQPGKHPL